MNKEYTMDKETLERWLDVLNLCYAAVVDMAERFPDWEYRLSQLDRVMDEIYITIKGQQ